MQYLILILFLLTACVSATLPDTNETENCIQTGEAYICEEGEPDPLPPTVENSITFDEK